MAQPSLLDQVANETSAGTAGTTPTATAPVATPAPTPTAPPTNTGSLLDQVASEHAASTGDTTGTGSTPPIDYTARLHQIEQQPFSGSAWNRVKQVGETSSAAADVLASDTLDAVKGAVHAFNPNPQTPEEVKARTYGLGLGAMYVYRMLNGLSPVARAAIHPTEIAKAIHDINASKDPTGTYLEIARDTASKGAAQALTAIGTEGVVKGGIVPKAVVNGVTHIWNPATEEVEAAAPKPAPPLRTGVVNRTTNVVNEVRQGKNISQPEVQSAVRSGLKSSVETTNANAIRNAEASVPPVDKYPVSIEHDADGNVVSADGRHRVVEAWARGDDTIPVTTKFADGATEVVERPPQSVAQKMGLGNTVEEAKAALEKTDANQPYRAGNGKPRTPAYETPKLSSDATPVKQVKVSEATEPLTTNAKQTIADDHLDALEQQKASAYKKMDEAAGFDVKALKDELKADEYNRKQTSDPDTKGKIIEAINDKTDRLADAEAKMKAAGIDPETADALNTRWEAGNDYRDSLIRRKNPDGTYNVNGLLTDARQLRNAKYGDRLEQWFGSKEAADSYVQSLEKAHAAGVKAMKTQALAKQIAWSTLWRAVPLGLGTYAAFKH